MAEKRKNLYNGSISYKKLWELLAQKEITKLNLKDPEKFNLSPTLVNRLVKNENVAVDTIMYLCDKLNCQPKDIVEFIPNKNESY